MNIVSLDVHTEASQLYAVTDEGEIIFETKVPTDPELLRTIIGGIAGPKRVVFEEGPLSAMLTDALQGVADEIVSCDATHNALIARNENSNDKHDARSLTMLARVGGLHPVLVPPEPYRTLRSLLVHDQRVQRWITATKNRIKSLCRRCGIRYSGADVYRSANRAQVLTQMTEAGLRWQMQSLYRQLDMLRRERVGAHRMTGRLARKLPVVRRLQSAPGVGRMTAQTLVAWIVDPARFKSRNALSSYAGLGLGQGWTNWKPVGRARASKRGQRQLKRLLFIAAKAAVRGKNALARRYAVRLQAGWEHSKAIRDIARTLLWTLCGMWKHQKEYDDAQVAVPDPPGA